jgi:hypothetical protein
MFAEALAHEALNGALFGYSLQRLAAVRPTDRFAHYTSADAAAKIIQGDKVGKRSLWLRNARDMNDFSEVQWGQQCLGEVVRDWRLHGRFKRVLDSIHPDIFGQLATALIAEEATLGDKAFLLSLSLHDERECRTGKLSMWRAYGGTENVCMIFNTAPFVTPQSAFEIVTSPVMYGGPLEFGREFEALLFRLEQAAVRLRVLSVADLVANLKRALDFAVLSTKHAGFHEEVEWRLIHQHSDFRPDPPSVEVEVRGKAQRVYQVPMENQAVHDVWGSELSEVLDRLLIGPTPREEINARRNHYIQLLGAAGVSNPEDRVSFCGIPLRVR